MDRRDFLTTCALAPVLAALPQAAEPPAVPTTPEPGASRVPKRFVYALFNDTSEVVTVHTTDGIAMLMLAPYSGWGAAPGCEISAPLDLPAGVLAQWYEA